MATEQEIKVALSMLDDVEEELKKKFEDLIAYPKSRMTSATRSAFEGLSYPLLEKCNSIIKKLKGFEPGEAYVHFIKAWIYGIQADYSRSIDEYNKALELKFEDVSRLNYHIAITYECWQKLEESIEYHQKVVDDLGVDNDLGMSSAKKIEDLKEKKEKSGCFIATAITGSELSNEVILLKDFRDTFLKNYNLGRLFIKLYYYISPPIARFININNNLQIILRNILIKPIIKFLRGYIKNSNLQNLQ